MLNVGEPTIASLVLHISEEEKQFVNAGDSEIIINNNNNYNNNQLLQHRLSKYIPKAHKLLKKSYFSTSHLNLRDQHSTLIEECVSAIIQRVKSLGNNDTNDNGNSTNEQTATSNDKNNSSVETTSTQLLSTSATNATDGNTNNSSNSKSKSSNKSTIPQKKKALVDLLKALSTWGLTYHVAPVNTITQSIQQSPFLPIRNIFDLFKSSGNEKLLQQQLQQQQEQGSSRVTK